MQSTKSEERRTKKCSSSFLRPSLFVLCLKYTLIICKDNHAMKNFTYFRPATADQAVSLLEARYGNTEMLAGGTDLLALQKNYIAQPGRVVSLNAIAGLKTITVGA